MDIPTPDPRPVAVLTPNIFGVRVQHGLNVPVALGTAIGLVVGVAFALASVTVDALVLRTIWGWLIVPSFHLGALPLKHAVAVCVAKSWARTLDTNTGPKPDVWALVRKHLVGTLLLRPAALLSVAFLVRFFFFN